MSLKVSDYILQRLREWGVEHVFAYAGDGINGLLDTDRTGMVRQGVKAKIQEFLPGKSHRQERKD